MALICSGVYLIQAESIYLRFRLNPGPWGKEYVQINMVWRWQSTLGGGRLERRQVVSDCFMIWMVCSIMHCTLLLCGHCRINMCKYDLSWNQTEEKHCFDKQQASPEKKAQVQKASSLLHFYCHWHENGLWKHELKLTAVFLFAACRRCMQLFKCSTNIIKQLGKLGHSRAIFIILVLGKQKNEAFILKASPSFSLTVAACSWLDGRLSWSPFVGVKWVHIKH